ncbi:MAG: putative DNA binding domain-containing protein, partial [Candidatus Methanomethylophilaceae archaeon]|nr:putative DNA binding domain-containing protein [Candidatus Methanomethylophilaceae archaeon]
ESESESDGRPDSMIPINIHSILDSNAVENQRIEFKRNWNPEKVLHSICAFANDYDDIFGGYIIIGVEEENGMPSKITGIQKETIDRINKELLNIVNIIEPRYEVFSECQEYKGNNVLLIWAPAGRDRPYQCPTSLSKRGGKLGYFIRKHSSSVCASPEQVRELFKISETVPFDDRINYRTSIDDLSWGLMVDFLKRTGSEYKTDDKSTLELAKDLHIVDGPPENLHPLNVGLMFFNDHPEHFFRQSYIDIQYKRDPTGTRMLSKEVRGPLDKQIVSAIDYVKGLAIENMILKIPGQPESITISSYPIEAVEETIVNAVLHKDYSISEPVRIEILPDRIETLSIPGPNRDISDEDIREGTLRSRSYRNRRIGEFLRELDLAEVKNTGIPKIMGEMARNGSPEPVFETDEHRGYMIVVLPIHREFLRDLPPYAKRRTAESINAELLSILSKRGEVSVADLAKEMGYTSVPSSLRKAIASLVASGSIERTEKSINSPNQKLRLKYRR